MASIAFTPSGSVAVTEAWSGQSAWRVPVHALVCDRPLKRTSRTPVPGSLARAVNAVCLVHPDGTSATIEGSSSSHSSTNACFVRCTKKDRLPPKRK
jgi:hypothetical protein